MSLLAALALFMGIAVAAGAPPTPPCSAPPGVVPAVPESLCYNQITPTDRSGVSIRSYGFPPNATFISGIAGGQYIQGVQGSIATALNYFAGSNDEQRNILSARTTPFAVTPPSASGRAYPYWTTYIQVSPAQFPDNYLIPTPNPGTSVTKTLVSSNIDLIAVFQFNTTGFPYLENFNEACGAIQNSTLPSGYAINASSTWSPAYVFYSPMAAVNFTNECWMAVFKL